MNGVDGVAEGVGAIPRTPVGRQLTRARARFRRRRLDADLAAGLDPWSSAEHLVRAQQLVSVAERRKVAIALETLVTCAERRLGVSPRLAPLRTTTVLSERAALVALARRLADLEPVPPRVVAELEWLLWDPRSPVFRGGMSPEALGHIAERCLSATD